MADVKHKKDSFFIFNNSNVPCLGPVLKPTNRYLGTDWLITFLVLTYEIYKIRCLGFTLFQCLSMSRIVSMFVTIIAEENYLYLKNMRQVNRENKDLSSSLFRWVGLLPGVSGERPANPITCISIVPTLPFRRCELYYEKTKRKLGKQL